jgi:hypothetical protein
MDHAADDEAAEAPPPPKEHLGAWYHYLRGNPIVDWFELRGEAERAKRAAAKRTRAPAPETAPEPAPEPAPESVRALYDNRRAAILALGGRVAAAHRWTAARVVRALADGEYEYLEGCFMDMGAAFPSDDSSSTTTVAPPANHDALPYLRADLVRLDKPDGRGSPPCRYRYAPIAYRPTRRYRRGAAAHRWAEFHLRCACAWLRRCAPEVASPTARLVTLDRPAGHVLRFDDALDHGAALHRALAAGARWRARVRRDWRRMRPGDSPEMCPDMGDVPDAHAEAMAEAARACQELTQLHGCGRRFRQACWDRGVRTIDQLHAHLRARPSSSPSERPPRIDVSPLLRKLVAANATTAERRPPVTFEPVAGPGVDDVGSLLRGTYACADFETMADAASGATWITVVVAQLYRCDTTEEDAAAAAPEAGGGGVLLDTARLVLRAAEPAEQAALLGRLAAWLDRHGAPRVVHWSAAEPQFLRRALAGCGAHLPERARRTLGRVRWVDLLRVCVDHHLVIDGAPNYKLKVVGRRLAALGLIPPIYAYAPLARTVDVYDGRAAEQHAKRVYARGRCTRRTVEQLRGVVRYCEEDVRLLEHIMRVLRRTLRRSGDSITNDTVVG